MRHRFLTRVAAIAVASLLSASGAALAASGSQPSKTCPTHKHQGEHNGASNGNNSQNKGTSHGNKCGIPGSIH